MQEWSAERRARWLYNNQANIEASAYNRGLQDAAVANEIAKLKAANAKPNRDYVDPEFANDPSMMYTQDHVEAVYNPSVQSEAFPHATLYYFMMTFFAIGIIFALGYLMFFKKYGA
jgi:hypothetical protein